MRSRLTAVLAVLLLLVPAVSQGWGEDAHRLLTARALDGLPPDLAAFMAAGREFVVEHSTDPDMWRVVGLSGPLGPESPNHFLNIDGLGDAPPFANVPRSHAAFVAKYGEAAAERAGRLPWQAEDVYRRLVEAFGKLPNGPAFEASDIRYLTAVLAHYIEDAYQPLHATANYDGQLTHQRGVHSRFETELVLRYRSSLDLAPVAIHPIPSFQEFMFDTIVSSQALAGAVLRADREAAADHATYDDAYYAAFFADVRPVLRERLSGASSGVASAIVSAWDEAGRPSLALPGARPPAPIRH